MPKDFDLSFPASCPTVTVDSGKGKYTWNRAGLDSRSELPCKSGDAGAKAFYYCNSRGEWHNLNVEACKYSNKMTEALQLYSNVSMFRDK